MKKTIFTVLALLMFSSESLAEAIVVIDQNGVVKQQIITIDNGQQTTNDAKQLTVVQESPIVSNSYYYDHISTEKAILAGVTTAVVGSVLYNNFRPAKHHRYKHFPKHHKKSFYKYKPIKFK